MGARGARQSAVESWIVPLPELKSWMRCAVVNDVLIYGHGIDPIPGETSAHAVSLSDAGEVQLNRRRAEDGAFDFLIRKRGTPRSDHRHHPRVDDASMDVIYRRLERCANLGQRAATNSELADGAGLATPAQAAWRVAKLIEAGLIRTEIITTAKEANWRIVTIAATGKSTAAPPSWERAKAQVRREVVK